MYDHFLTTSNANKPCHFFTFLDKAYLDVLQFYCYIVNQILVKINTNQ